MQDVHWEWSHVAGDSRSLSSHAFVVLAHVIITNCYTPSISSIIIIMIIIIII